MSLLCPDSGEFDWTPKKEKEFIRRQPRRALVYGKLTKSSFRAVVPFSRRTLMKKILSRTTLTSGTYNVGETLEIDQLRSQPWRNIHMQTFRAG